MKVKGLAFVGIPVTDMKRARAFYEGVLGLKFQRNDGWKVGRIFTGQQHARHRQRWSAVAALRSRDRRALEVENFDEAVESLKDRHVPFTTEPFESPCCWMAIIKDPDGNNIVIHKLKPENEKEPCL